MPKQVVLTTNHGEIRIELDEAKAPESARNFLEYVNKGHYDGTVFHRVIKGFMIQGGGFDTAMKQKPTAAPIRNEANNGLKNMHYTLAMARTNVPDSATAQFFINTTDNDFLNFRSETPQGWGYAVFGKVVAGTDVVDKIEGVRVATKRLPRERAGRGRGHPEGGRARLRACRAGRHGRPRRCSGAARPVRVPGPAGLAVDRLHLGPAPGGRHAAHLSPPGRHICGTRTPMRSSSSATCSRSGSATMHASTTSSGSAWTCWHRPPPTARWASWRATATSSSAARC